MAQTLKFGNGTWATKKDSILAYNDENENYKPLPFNYTGAGKGTRVNKEGLIEVVENDRPRIDYKDSEDGVFLLEKAATNLVTYSEDFSQSAWTKSNSSITSNSVISPDGSLNADKLKEDSTNTYHRLANVLSISNGVSYSVSIFVKRAERRYVRFASAFGSGDALTDFDILNGTVLNGNGSIKDYGNGWFKITNNFTADSTFTSINVFQLFLLNDDKVRDYQGDGTSGVYVYGAQLETGNLSSYIPTQGTIQTRVAETASGSGNSEVFNDSEGVLFADIAANANDLTNKGITISDGSVNNRVTMFYTNVSNAIQVKVVVGGSNSLNSYITIPNISLYNKFALKYKQNDFSLYVNGFELITDTSGITFSNGTLTELAFDRGDGGEDFYGKTKEIAYYDTVLTDLELETLTSYRSWLSMVNELNLNVIYNG